MATIVLVWEPVLRNSSLAASAWSALVQGACRAISIARPSPLPDPHDDAGSSGLHVLLGEPCQSGLLGCHHAQGRPVRVWAVPCDAADASQVASVVGAGGPGPASGMPAERGPGRACSGA